MPSATTAARTRSCRDRASFPEMPAGTCRRTATRTLSTNRRSRPTRPGCAASPPPPLSRTIRNVEVEYRRVEGVPSRVVEQLVQPRAGLHGRYETCERAFVPQYVERAFGGAHGQAEQRHRVDRDVDAERCQLVDGGQLVLAQLGDVAQDGHVDRGTIGCVLVETRKRLGEQ